jgi:hypothetical protein
MASISLMKDAPRMARSIRRPRIDMAMLMLPYSLVPFGVMPVLAGETMKNLYQSLQFVSDPLFSRFQAGYIETSYFYVKHSQMGAIAPNLIDMHVKGIAVPAGNYAVARNKPTYCAIGALDVVSRCYDAVVKWWYRDADEALVAPTGNSLDGYYLAQIKRQSWMHSMKLAAAGATVDEILPGEVEEQPTLGLDEASYATHYDQWLRMRRLGYTASTYEDYLVSQGETPAREHDEELLRPELICRFSEYVGPANTVEPSTGVPTTAHVKALPGSHKASVRFREPGYLIGIACYRPKVHYAGVKGTMAGFMVEADDWFPESLADQGYTSLKKFASNTGPAAIATTGAVDTWVDLRDYLLYGEEQRNFDYDATTAYTTRATSMFGPALPDANSNFKYMAPADAPYVFQNPTQFVRMRSEGVVAYDIATHIGGDTTD